MSLKPKVEGVNRSKHPLYGIWCDMRRRCYDEKFKHYNNYGGRGIKVCDRWLGDFANFVADVGCRPKDHSLDRINNDGNYSPENIRWADRVTQNGNTRATQRSTGVPGVSRNASGGYRARFKRNGVEVHLGNFETVQEASDAIEDYKLTGIKRSKTVDGNKTGFKNVYYHPENEYYYTQFTLNGKRFFGKVFKTAKEASDYVERRKAEENKKIKS